ncbi:response regulator [Candidatus Saccharibacteria bacterium]|nr:MAG: response regulator [Candidatus Saccharibacteria bacterium]
MLCYTTTMTRIAIIEDDPVISQMYRMKFEAEGFEVMMASDGESGVALVKDALPDIILLDLQMPNMDGAEALQKIRANKASADTPVLILTNLGEEEAPDIIKLLNVSSYIVKADLTPKQVVSRVKETLEM